MQPSKEASKFADIIAATLSGHWFTVAFRNRTTAEDAEYLIASGVVEKSQVLVRQIGHDRLDLVDLGCLQRIIAPSGFTWPAVKPLFNVPPEGCNLLKAMGGGGSLVT